MKQLYEVVKTVENVICYTPLKDKSVALVEPMMCVVVAPCFWEIALITC